MGIIVRLRDSLASHLGSRRAGRWRWRASAPMVAMTLLAFVVPATLAACGGTSAGGGSDTLVFGAPVSLTGSLSHEGTDTLNGYNLWADQANAKGGVKVGDRTYKVKIKYYDDGSSAHLRQSEFYAWPVWLGGDSDNRGHRAAVSDADG